MIILFGKSQLSRVQKCLMDSGYGKGVIEDRSKTSIQLGVSHDQLCSAKEMQDYLRKEIGDSTIICR